ncbi:unnamed protein product [Allacma fusca]|uniref:Uncharacterized protein n=1 Tax=Allacma fusca TaxID=39272 RepID=A0A8J2NVW1_9HEXA|nr:unnamed protein product [Allacma fusca]
MTVSYTFPFTQEIPSIVGVDTHLLLPPLIPAPSLDGSMQKKFFVPGNLPHSKFSKFLPVTGNSFILRCRT